MLNEMNCASISEKIKETSPTSKDQSEMNDMLISSASEGDCEEVKKLLRKGADPLAVDDQELSAFLHACFFGHLEVVQILTNTHHSLIMQALPNHEWTSSGISKWTLADCQRADHW